MSGLDYKSRADQISVALRTSPAPDSQSDLIDLLTDITASQGNNPSLIITPATLAEMLSCVERENWIRLADILQFEVDYKTR